MRVVEIVREKEDDEIEAFDTYIESIQQVFIECHSQSVQQ